MFLEHIRDDAVEREIRLINTASLAPGDL